MRVRPLLQYLFFCCIVRPLAYVIIGLNIRHPQRLHRCACGPGIIVANHNSHLDTIVLMSLFPLKTLSRLRPVGAADYFHHHWLLKMFSHHLMGLLPVHRKTPDARESFYAQVNQAIARNEILIFYPEGTRGDPEQMGEFKTGIAYIAKAHPQVPIIPVFLQGLGKSLPRGEALFVPFFCDVSVGEALHWEDSQTVESFLGTLKQTFSALASECPPPSWD